MAKIRRDSLLKTLPQDVRREIFERAARGADVEGELVPWLAETQGVTASRATVYRFLAWYGDMRQILEARTYAEELKEELAAGGQVKSPEELEAVAQAAFSLQVTRAGDVAGWRSLQEIDLKKRQLALAERAQATKEDALALAREKFEAAEKREAAAKGVCNDAALSDEERVAKIKGIFGLA